MLAFKRNFPARIGLFCLLLLMSFWSFAQTTTVSGTILGTDNAPLSGASVVQKGTNKGTTTDQKGFFSLTVTGAKPVLLISMVGYQPYSLNYTGTGQVAIKLEATASDLQDVVVVGYGTQKKINQTGSTQTVKFDDAVNQPVTNSGQLMYGKFSGVQITQGSGLPGADASSVLIRGLGTFGNSNPLVVIDNIQFSGLNEFNNLSPADIESISVLKDASASSIYGARGANGVIIVTTKKGKSGSSSVVYNSYVGFQKATVIPKYLGAVDYATLINERDINQTGPTTNLRYSPADIQAIIDGSNKDQFSNWILDNKGNILILNK
jgi:TonB-dependent SusC/RagA subfamily outer membrane receptor